MAAEDTGSVYVELRLALKQMEKDGLAAQKALDKLARKFKQQGTAAGKGFAAGVKIGFNDVEQSAARLGKSIGKSIAPQMIALQAGIKIIRGIASAFKDVFMSNKEFAKGIADIKSSLGQGFADAVKPVSDFFANIIQKVADSVEKTRALRQELTSLNGEATTDSPNVSSNTSSEKKSNKGGFAPEEWAKKAKELWEKIPEEAITKAKELWEKLKGKLKKQKNKGKKASEDTIQAGTSENPSQAETLDEESGQESLLPEEGIIKAKELWEKLKGKLKENLEKIINRIKEISEETAQEKPPEETKEPPKPKSNNRLANLLGLDDEQFGKMMQTGEAAISAFDSISNAVLDINRKHAEAQIAIIDEALKQTLASIEKARQEELIAAGFVIENNIESLEAQLEAAKRTGDEVLIYQAERRAEEQRINDEYDAQAKAAKEQAALEKAEIEFKLARQNYAMQLVNAVNAGIMAVLQASNNMWPVPAIPMMAAAGVATAAQIAILAKNPPKPPKFANSGIVPGNKYFGDRNVAAVDSGELILNRAHQDNIADQLTAGGGMVTATIVVMLDGREIGQNTFDLANKGHYTLKTRVIQG